MCYDMGSLAGVGYRFQPTPEELINYLLKKKRRDPAFTHLNIKEVNIYMYHPCELPGLSPIQSDEQVWYFYCTLDQKYAKSDRASRTAEGGYWKITGADRDVRAKHSNKLIGFKKILVFYNGCSSKKEKTNWVMHEYHLKKDTGFKGEVVICRIERKPDKKKKPSSALDKEQPSDNLANDSGNNIAGEDIPQVEPQLPQSLLCPSSSNNHVKDDNGMEVESHPPPNLHLSPITKNIYSEMEFQLLPNQLKSSNEEDLVAKCIAAEVEPLVCSEWDAPIDCNNGLDHNSFFDLQSPISSFIDNSYMWSTPLYGDQDDDFEYLQWIVQDDFFGKETGQALPPNF